MGDASDGQSCPSSNEESQVSAGADESGLSDDNFGEHGDTTVVAAEESKIWKEQTQSPFAPAKNLARSPPNEKKIAPIFNAIKHPKGSASLSQFSDSDVDAQQSLQLRSCGTADLSQKKLEDHFVDLDIELQALEKILRSQPKIKKEVRAISIKFRTIVNHLRSRNSKEWLDIDSNANQEFAGGLETKASQCDFDLNNEKNERYVGVSVGCQTVEPQVIKEEIACLTLRDKFKEDLPLSELAEIVSLKWPKSIFKSTKFTKKSIQSRSPDVARVLILDKNNVNGDSNLRLIINQYPALKRLKQEEISTEKLTIIKCDESVQINGSLENPCGQIIIIGGFASDDVCQLGSTISKIREETKNRGIKKTLIACPKEIEVEQIKKMVEIYFGSSGIDSEICVPKKQRVAHQKISTTKQTKTSGQQMLIIKSNQESGSSFADVVKDLKTNINPQELGVSITKMTKLADGNLKVQFKERKTGGKEAFITGIQANVKTVKSATIKNRELGIIVYNLEEGANKDEIADALTESLNIPKNEIRMNDLRKGTSGTNMITVYMPRLSALKAINMQKIKIGWTLAKIKEKLDPLLCFNCQSFGHLASACKKERVQGRRCLKCGALGHPAKYCENNESCFMCNCTGHRANSMTCPKYRSLVNDMKRDRLEKAGTK